MIRFDGQEFVLGNGEFQGVTIEALQAHVKALLKAERRRSATALVALHRSAAHRCVVSRWATSPDDPTVVFMAQALDRLEFAEADFVFVTVESVAGPPEKGTGVRGVPVKNALRVCIATEQPCGMRGRPSKLAEAFGHPLPMGRCRRGWKVWPVWLPANPMMPRRHFGEVSRWPSSTE